MAGELKAYEHLILIRSSVAAVAVLGAVAAVTVPQHVNVLCGLAFGFVFSLLKLRLQVRNLARFGATATHDGRKATGYLMSRTMMSFATVAGVLLIAGLNPDVLSLPAAAAGLFLTNAVIVISEIVTAVARRGAN